MNINNFAMVIGFLDAPPQLVNDQKSKDKVCVFHLMTRDRKTSKRVKCLATGKLCDQMLVYGLQGTFWAVGGVLYEWQSSEKSASLLTLKVIEIELLRTPKIPGIGVKQFVEKYSPENIIKRAQERKYKK